MAEPSSYPKLPYRAGLDGLRAVAVLGVFFFHLQFSWALGGYLGVETFFVISGYLITSLLLEDYRANGRLNLKRFWTRRIRRLWPALWLLLLGAVILGYTLSPPTLHRLREDVPAAVLYFTNWLYILKHIPYFERYASPPLLRHLWSLAVEEQFYVLWPLLLWGSLRLLKVRAGFPKKWWAVFPAALAALSAAWMGWIMHTTGNTVRAYYGTDARAAGFLLGGALAVLWPLAKPVRLPKIGKAAAALSGAVGLLGLLWLYARAHEFLPWLYPWGFLATDFFTALLIASAVHPEGWWGGVLGHPVLRWVGTRSYAIYLWHWPLIALFRPGAECRWPLWLCAAGHLTLAFLLAEWSYRMVENPIRRRGVAAWWRETRANAWRLAGFPALLVGVGLFVSWRPWAASAPQPFVETASAAALEVSPTAPRPTATPTLVMQSTAAPTSAAPAALASPSPTTALAASARPSPTPSPTPRWACSVTLLGDSVMARTYSAWMAHSGRYFKFYIDAKPNRQPKDIIPLLSPMRRAGHLYHTVVLHIGTNAMPSRGALDEIISQMARLGVHKVYLLTIRRPVGWEGLANQNIAAAVKDWQDLAVLVDWHAASEGHPEWFLEDGVHLNAVGAQAYVNLTLDSIRRNGCAP